MSLKSSARLALVIELLTMDEPDFCVSPDGYTDVNGYILLRVDEMLEKYPVLSNMAGGDNRATLLETAEFLKEYAGLEEK